MSTYHTSDILLSDHHAKIPTQLSLILVHNFKLIRLPLDDHMLTKTSNMLIFLTVIYVVKYQTPKTVLNINTDFDFDIIFDHCKNIMLLSFRRITFNVSPDNLP